MADDEAACVEIEVRIGKFGGSPIPDETTASLQFRNERLRQMRDCAIKAGGRYASNADFTDQHNFSTYAKLVIPVKVMRAMSLAMKRMDLEVLGTTLLDKGRAADGDDSEALCYFLAEGEDGRTLRAPAPKTGFEMLCFLKHYCSFVKATAAEAELVYGPKESAVSKNSSKTSTSTSASSGTYEDAPAATAAQDAAHAPAVASGVVKTTTPASSTSASAEELESLAVEFLRNTPLSLLRTVTESGMDAPNERARLSVQNWDDFDDEETRKAYPPAPPRGEISTGMSLSREYLRYPDSVDEFAASLVGPVTAKRRGAMFFPERVVIDGSAEYSFDPEMLEKKFGPRWNAVRGRAARVEPPEPGRIYVPPRLRSPPRVVPATPSRIILHVTEVPGMYKRRFADPVFESFAAHDVAFRDKLVGGFTSPLPVSVQKPLETPLKKLHAHQDQHRLLLRNGLLNRSWFPNCRNAPRYGGETAALRAIFGSAVRVLGETGEAIFRGDGGRLREVALSASGGSAEETHLKVGDYVAAARDELCLRALEGIAADRDSDRGPAACARFALDKMWMDLEGHFVAREEVDEKPTTFGPIPKQHSFEPGKRTTTNTHQELVPPARASTASGGLQIIKGEPPVPGKIFNVFAALPPSTSAAVEPRNPLWAPRGNGVCPAATVGGPENKAGNGANQPVDGQEKLHEPDGEETQLYPLLYFMVKERLWRSAKYVIQNLSWRRDGAGKREQYRSCLWLRRRVVHDIEKWVDRHTWVMICSWIPEEGTGRQ